MIKKIISGGQTGADQGGLEAAKILGISTGGQAPKDFRTENGYAPEFEMLYSLEESNSVEYTPRTRFNVINSDGTVIFGDLFSSGSKLTKEICKENRKPYFTVEEPNEHFCVLFKEWIRRNKIEVLNVAGNRESKNPGLQKKVREFLIKVFES